jgi:RHS repeat-associated protein
MPFADATGAGVQPYKYNNKELDGRNGLNMYDSNMRYYDFPFPHTLTPDPLSEKYYSLSPYSWVANNPINAIDPRGDSIWYTIDNDVVTMHVTAKMINKSSDNINMKKAANQLSTWIAAMLNGKFDADGKSYTLKVEMQLNIAESMDDVAESDHLFVLADCDYTVASGAINMIGGKVMTINADDYANDNWFSNIFIPNNDTRTGTHEFGHAAGLTHEDASGFFNLMTSGGSGMRVTSAQRLKMIQRKGAINQGQNSLNGKPYPYIYYYDPKKRGLVRDHINSAGLRHK